MEYLVYIYIYIYIGGAVVSSLAESHGISCIDVNLEDPITVIVDNVTAICLTNEVCMHVHVCMYVYIFIYMYVYMYLSIYSD
jgi:hypothetical protein